MKKVLLTLLLVLAVSCTVFAASFSFDFTPKTAMYREAYADPYAFTTKMNIVVMPDYLKFGAIYATADNPVAQYEYLDIKKNNSEKDFSKIQLKLGTSIGFAHFAVDKANGDNIITGELNMAGYLNTMFQMGGGGDNIGYDGSYFFGSTARLFDRGFVRLGFHHFSGHYGDETLEYVYNTYFAREDAESPWTYVDNPNKYFVGQSEYVRDNSWLVNMAYEFPFNMRVYAGLEVPMKKSWLRPFYMAPNDQQTGGTYGSDGIFDLSRREINDESVQEETAALVKSEKPSSYQALRVSFGVDWFTNVKPGVLYCGFDVQGHQDGQTNYNVGAYDKNSLWAWELTATTGLEFGPKILNTASVGVEASVHYGRPPLLNYFYQDNVTYFTLGVCIH